MSTQNVTTPSQLDGSSHRVDLLHLETHKGSGVALCGERGRFLRPRHHGPAEHCMHCATLAALRGSHPGAFVQS